MKIYNPTYSLIEPPEIEITKTKVFVSSNIQSVEREAEGNIETCYSFVLTEYDKDEYITMLAANQADIAALQEELTAAKILLGVE